MKKLLYSFIAISFASATLCAQDASNNVRFGLFVRGTPSWYGMTTNSYYSKNGAVFGTGFGLTLEFKISDVVSFQTGIGGDFDGGKINYSHNNNGSGPNSFATGYILDNTPALVEINGHTLNDFIGGKYTYQDLVTRHIHTTYVTIPFALKMKTKEISGFKYFGVFGGSLGVLASAKADDGTNNNPNGAIVNYNGLSIYKDCIPVRVGLNVGAGAEYRIAGTTSLFLSVNFVNSFISTVKSSSVYNATSIDAKGNFTYASQKLNANGLQINIGVLF